MHPNRYFGHNEYVLADSGYSPHPNVVPAFKRPAISSLAFRAAQFNYAVSNTCVKIEHCIGMLKSRFQSLKGMRLLLRKKSDFHRLVNWIHVCCIVHNFLINDEVLEEWDEGDRFSRIDTSNAVNLVDAQNNSLEGKQRRQDLLDLLFPPA